MTARIETSWSGNKSLADKSGDGSELALESLRDSHDLDSANLRAQGHEAALQRSFSPLAAVGLGFRTSSTVDHKMSSLDCSLQQPSNGQSPSDSPKLLQHFLPPE
ncbi:MAG: hypothetical protein Q9170_007394 [Blastenia crenularia]